MTATHAARVRPLEIVLRVLVAVGLAVDAFVHLRLAAGYQMAQPSGIGQGNLFRIEAVVAILVAIYVLVRGSRLAYAVAVVVAISAFGAAVLYRYVEVPALGPIPTMYEPIWFFQKTLSAVAEAAAGVLAIIGLLLPRRPTSAGPSMEQDRTSQHQ